MNNKILLVGGILGTVLLGSGIYYVAQPDTATVVLTNVATPDKPVTVDLSKVTPVWKEVGRTEQVTVNTEVEYTFMVDGQEVKKDVIVSHFMPKSEKEIDIGIKNRYISELRNLLTPQTNQ